MGTHGCPRHLVLHVVHGVRPISVAGAAVRRRRQERSHRHPPKPRMPRIFAASVPQGRPDAIEYGNLVWRDSGSRVLWTSNVRFVSSTSGSTRPQPGMRALLTDDGELVLEGERSTGETHRYWSSRECEGLRARGYPVGHRGRVQAQGTWHMARGRRTAGQWALPCQVCCKHYSHVRSFGHSSSSGHGPAVAWWCNCFTILSGGKTRLSLWDEHMHNKVPASL